MGVSPNQLAIHCLVCGGLADEVEVTIDFWRGGVEPLVIRACRDLECEAYYAKVAQPVCVSPALRGRRKRPTN